MYIHLNKGKELDREKFLTPELKQWMHENESDPELLRSGLAEHGILLSIWPETKEGYARWQAAVARIAELQKTV